MNETGGRIPEEQRLATAESQAAVEAAAETGPDGTTRGAVRAGRDAATTAELIQGGARQVTAERVEIRQGGAARANANEITVRQGGIGLARAERISLEMGAIGAAFGSKVVLRQGLSRLTAAREWVRLEQSGALAVLANRVEIGRQSGVVFLFARNVHGDVRPLFDWRGGLALGAG
ncbi:MAG: hypothetical protein M3301_01235, partial [Chloroflexota bacterium]|nr:hypothetical protein [Chloroflexota bacterium]